MNLTTGDYSDRQYHANAGVIHFPKCRCHARIEMGSVAKLLLIAAGSAAVWGGTVTVTDLFNVPGSSDVTGNRRMFDAQGIQVTITGSTLTIDIRTNYGNANLSSIYDTGVRLNPGDIFVSVNGAYRYGIPIAYHNGPAGGPWGERLFAGHIYEIDSQSALLNARQVLHDPMYLDYRPDALVWMIDLGGVHDVTRGTPTVQVLPIEANDGLHGPLYDIRVITSLPAELFSSATDTYGLSFAVSTGGHDLVEGALNFRTLSGPGAAGAAVPEPGTWYLMIGAALIGLARMAMRSRP